MKPAPECAGFIRVLSFRVRLCTLCGCVRRISYDARTATEMSIARISGMHFLRRSSVYSILLKNRFYYSLMLKNILPRAPEILLFPCGRFSAGNTRFFSLFPISLTYSGFSCLRFPEQHLPTCGKGFSGLRKRLFRCAVKALWRCCKARSAVWKSLFRVVTPPVSCRGRAVSGLQSVRGGTSDA